MNESSIITAATAAEAGVVCVIVLEATTNDVEVFRHLKCVLGITTTTLYLAFDRKKGGGKGTMIREEPVAWNE